MDWLSCHLIRNVSSYTAKELITNKEVWQAYDT